VIVAGFKYIDEVLDGVARNAPARPKARGSRRVEVPNCGSSALAVYGAERMRNTAAAAIPVDM